MDDHQPVSHFMVNDAAPDGQGLAALDFLMNQKAPNACYDK